MYESVGTISCNVSGDKVRFLFVPDCDHYAKHKDWRGAIFFKKDADPKSPDFVRFKPFSDDKVADLEAPMPTDADAYKALVDVLLMVVVASNQSKVAVEVNEAWTVVGISEAAR